MKELQDRAVINMRLHVSEQRASTLNDENVGDVRFPYVFLVATIITLRGKLCGIRCPNLLCVEPLLCLQHFSAEQFGSFDSHDALQCCSMLGRTILAIVINLPGDRMLCLYLFTSAVFIRKALT